MEMSPKALIIIVLVIIGMFAGGLFMVIRDSKNQALTLEYTQELISSNSQERRTVLEAELRRRLVKRSIAMTTKANFDSYEQLIALAQACDRSVRAGLAIDSSEVKSYNQLWTECMEN